MSYDVWIAFDGCGHCGHTPGSYEIGNYTSNVSAMWSESMPYRPGMIGAYSGDLENLPDDDDEYHRTGIAGLSGMTSLDAIPILQEGIAWMEANRERCKELEPDNGWGNYTGALKFLYDCLAACTINPQGRFAADW